MLSSDCLHQTVNSQTETTVAAFLYPTPLPPATGTKCLAQCFVQGNGTLAECKGRTACSFCIISSLLHFYVVFFLMFVLFISLREKRKKKHQELKEYLLFLLYFSSEAKLTPPSFHPTNKAGCGILEMYLAVTLPEAFDSTGSLKEKKGNRTSTYSEKKLEQFFPWRLHHRYLRLCFPYWMP